jgi:hypothetical protein
VFDHAELLNARQFYTSVIQEQAIVVMCRGDTLATKIVKEDHQQTLQSP